MVKGMNFGHEKLASWARGFLKIESTYIVADLGCGGGRNVEYFLTKANKVYGMDYSTTSVEIASRLNQKAIQEGKCEIIQGDVTILPFEDESIDVGSLTNPLKLSNRYASEKKINISNNTISKYLTYFEDAYVLYAAKRYDIKGSKYFSTPLKHYFADIGLRNARLNFRQVEETHIMENIIYNDLLRRGFNVDVGVVEYFPSVEGKTTRVQLEVDFVINRGNLRYYIQSAFAINSEEKKEQERNSLKRIDDSFKKIIIVRDNIVPRYDEYGIYYVGIRDFLIMDDFLEA